MQRDESLRPSKPWKDPDHFMLEFGSLFVVTRLRFINPVVTTGSTARVQFLFLAATAAAQSVKRPVFWSLKRGATELT